MRAALVPIALVLFGLTAMVALQCAPKVVKRTPGVYDLSYNMPSGTEFTMSTTTNHMNQRVVMGTEHVTNSVDRTELGFEVKATGKHGMTTELEYKGVHHETDDPQARGEVDFSELVGKSVQFVLSPKGKLSGFVGFDELPEIEIPEAQRTLTEDVYVYEVIGIFPEFPKHTVKMGDTWSFTREYGEPIPGGEVKLTIEYNYTVMEETTQNGIDCVKLRGQHTSAVEGYGESGGLAFDVAMTGTVLETSFFSWEKGMFVGSESMTSMEGAAKNVEMGISVPMRHEYRGTVDIIFK
jgi:hypothetical protein